MFLFVTQPKLNPTHLPKHQTLSPNLQFSQRIWYVEYHPVHAHMAWSQKFCLTLELIFSRKVGVGVIFWIAYSSGSQSVVRVPLVVREGFSGGTRAVFLSYSKSFVNSFLCYNLFVCYANVANSFMCYIYLKYIWANYVLLKPGVYTPTLKKHQVVRDLKKFENHWLIAFKLEFEQQS